MSQYNRHGILTINAVISQVNKLFNKNKGTKVTFDGYPVGVGSIRMRTFGKAGKDTNNNICCVSCGLNATYFAIETFAKGPVPDPHVNLYGIREDGTEVLFTHDHIIARALGGEDNIGNAQVMCSPCNHNKGKVEGRLVEKLRKENVTKA